LCFNLPDILWDFKKFTSKAIKKTISDNIQQSRKDWLLKQVKGSVFGEQIIKLLSNGVME